MTRLASSVGDDGGWGGAVRSGGVLKQPEALVYQPEALVYQPEALVYQPDNIYIHHKSDCTNPSL